MRRCRPAVGATGLSSVADDGPVPDPVPVPVPVPVPAGPDPVADLRRDYRPRFLAWLTRRDEEGLAAAYDLGRRSLQRGTGLLDLVRVHHDVYAEVVADARDLDEAGVLARDAAAFLLEALAPFEMTQRGFMAGDGLGQQSRPGDSGVRSR